MSSQNDDNVYINAAIAQRAITDLLKKPECQCGSTKFTIDDEKFTCSDCGRTYDRNQNDEESAPDSTP
jgi:tRNA(Ile2) C34 agmatinyltransferase TiaS